MAPVGGPAGGGARGRWNWLATPIERARRLKPEAVPLEPGPFVLFWLAEFAEQKSISFHVAYLYEIET